MIMIWQNRKKNPTILVKGFDLPTILGNSFPRDF